MKWLIGGLFVGGCASCWLSLRSYNDYTQSADVRVPSGDLFAVVGLGALGLDALMTIGWLVWRA